MCITNLCERINKLIQQYRNFLHWKFTSERILSCTSSTEKEGEKEKEGEGQGITNHKT